MKKIYQQLTPFLLFITLIFTTSIVYAAEKNYTESDFSATYYVSSSKGLNVRSGPSTDYDKIATLSYGQAVTITGKTDNDWYRTSINCKDGYVSAKYVSLQAPVTNPNSTDSITSDETEHNSETSDETQDIMDTIRSSIVSNHIVLLFVVIILAVICLIIFTAYSFIKDSKTYNEYTDDNIYDSDISNDDSYNYYDTNNNDDYQENDDENYYNSDIYMDDDKFQ